MIAVDTNVLVRVITNDDSGQAPLAARLLNRHDKVFISKTVLLELEWVLRSAYKIGAAHILKALIEFRDRPNVEIEDEAAGRRRLGLVRAGNGLRRRAALGLGWARVSPCDF